MLKRKILVTLAKVEEPDWFKAFTKEQQEAYLEEHPNSKLAKSIRQNSAKKASEPPKEKKDPYKDVPEADKKAMLLAKERGFAVPPAWRNVWVNPDPEGDLQVKGTMFNKRKQKDVPTALYSVNHNTRQAAIKFERLKKFSSVLPTMSKSIEKDMKEGNEEAKVLYLISKMGFRIGGGPEDAGEHQSFGASTITSDHIKIEGTIVHFDFPGKHAVRQQHLIDDPIIAKMFKGAKGKPGPLFKTSPKKIHKYLDSISGENHFKVHDFRTYTGTTTALQELSKVEQPKTQKEYEKAVLAVCTVVSKKLGNTPVMARDSYVDPTVFKQWKDSIDMDDASTKNKEQSSDAKESVEDLLSDFFECNHYQLPKELVAKYREVEKLPRGSVKREKFYTQFQQLAKRLKLVDTKDKTKYLKSLQDLEGLLKTREKNDED